MNHLSRRHFLTAAASAPLVLLPMQAAQAACTNCASGKGKKGVAGMEYLDIAYMSFQNPNSVEISYDAAVRNLEGRVLGSSRGLLPPGRGAFVRFDFTREMPVGERVQLHFEVRGTEGLPIASTVEIVDRRLGHTRLTMEPGIEPGAPLLPSLASLGLIAGQRLLVSVFDARSPELPEAPFQVEIRALNSKLLARLQGSTRPGGGSIVEWGAGDPGFPELGLRRRLQVQVAAHLSDVDNLGTALEIFDARARRTLVLTQPNVLALK